MSRRDGFERPPHDLGHVGRSVERDADGSDQFRRESEPQDANNSEQEGGLDQEGRVADHLDKGAKEHAHHYRPAVAEKADQDAPIAPTRKPIPTIRTVVMSPARIAQPSLRMSSIMCAPSAATAILERASERRQHVYDDEVEDRCGEHRRERIEGLHRDLLRAAGEVNDRNERQDRRGLHEERQFAHERGKATGSIWGTMTRVQTTRRGRASARAASHCPWGTRSMARAGPRTRSPAVQRQGDYPDPKGRDPSRPSAAGEAKVHQDTRMTIGSPRTMRT